MTAIYAADDPTRVEPADPHRWLEAADDAEVVRWTARQEAAFARAASSWRQRDAIAERLAHVSARSGRYGTPRPAGRRLFYTDLPPDAEYPLLVVAEAHGEPRTLIDPMRLDPDGNAVLEHWEPSPDGSRLAYQVSYGGTEDSLLFVLDVASGAIVDGPIDRVRKTSVGWLPDASAFYYVRRLHPARTDGEARYHRRVHLHRIGADPDSDPVVFGEGRGKTQHYAVRTSSDGRWLTVSAAAGTDRDRELWLADLAAASLDEPELRRVCLGSPAYSTLHIPAATQPDGGCYVLTDLGAPRSRLAVTTPGNPASDGWRDLIPGESDSVLEDFAILDGPDVPRPVLLVARIRHAVGEIAVHDAADGARIATLPIPAGGTVGALRTAPAQACEAWFTHTSFTEPAVVFRYDARSDETTQWTGGGSEASADRTPVSPLAPALETRQMAFTSADGTRVHMFVIARADVLASAGDRPVPALLTAYGGFGHSVTPAYSPEAVVWAEAGGVYAVANIRGGGEEGEDWHRAGMREHKAKCFEDFEAAAAALVAAGLTTPRQLGIWGSSNGGLLVGAALTRRPEAYAAAACIAPLLDMARYELSGMGPSWTGEYGTATDPEQLGWLMSYSPYHHVRPGARYPATLFAVFDGDTRVDPLHARKMCAAMQAATSGRAPILLRAERGAGHGVRALSRRTDLFADLLAFFADHLGLDGPLPSVDHTADGESGCAS